LVQIECIDSNGIFLNTNKSARNYRADLRIIADFGKAQSREEKRAEIP
jgi:hypothetical protein